MAISRASDSSIQDGLPKFNDIWDGTTATSAFDSLGSILISASTASITFSNIPQTYTHLHLRTFTRSSEGGASDVTLLGQFNGEITGTNYSYHRMYAYGSTVNADSSVSGSSVSLGNVATDGNTGSNFTSGIIDILDYTSSNKHKTTRSFSGFDNNSNGSIHFASGSYRPSSIAGITSILLKPSGGSFMS